MSFVKIDRGILDSSLWLEDPVTRLTFITMIAMAEHRDGRVASTAPGIARRANLPLDGVRRALEILETRDPDSKSEMDEGRRIRRVDGGYAIVNFLRYHRFDETNAQRQRRFRENHGVTHVTPDNANNTKKEMKKKKEKETTETETNTPLPPTGGDRVVEIFDHWRDVMAHPSARLDPKRHKVIKAALGLGYTTEQLKRAVDGYRASPWHRGGNDRGATYDALGLILRDAEHVDRGLSLVEEHTARATVAHPPQLETGRERAERLAREQQQGRAS